MLFAILRKTHTILAYLLFFTFLAHLSAAQQQALTGREFFPHLLSGPFHAGLVVVFAFGAVLALLAAIASLLRGAGDPGATGAVPGQSAPEATSGVPATATAG